MRFQSPSSAKFVLKLGFLVLALSVFSWRVQARLSTYHPHNPTLGQSAKFAPETQQLNSIDIRQRHRGLGIPTPAFRLSPLALLFRGHVVAVESNLRIVQRSIATPARYDSLGPHRLDLPPPARA